MTSSSRSSVAMWWVAAVACHVCRVFYLLLHLIPRRPSKPRRHKDDSQRESHCSSSLPPNSGHTPGQLQQEKVSVPGAHKVWGTMKACTTPTVSTTIPQLCPTVAGKLQLHRKFNNRHVTRKWFHPRRRGCIHQTTADVGMCKHYGGLKSVLCI